MIKQLNTVNRIYDLLALCSSYILNEINENPYEFSLFNEEDFDCVYDAIGRYCNEKQEKGEKRAFSELKDFLLDYMESEITIEKCFAVITFIDELVDIEINDKLLGKKHIIKYSSINEQYTDRVRIIPKMKETFLKRGEIIFKNKNNKYSLFRNRRECPCSVLDREVLNYMIWDEEHIRNYPMWIYRFDENSILFQHFYQREKIVFGIIPFTNKNLSEILDVKYEERTFYIDGMHKNAEDELKRRYEDIYDRSKNEDIDFLIFPEMLLTENIISSIRNKEKENSSQIIINGSIWENYTNRSVVTDRNGEEIFSYYKKEPFELDREGISYREYLNRDKNTEYFIMEVEGIGRIGIGICKDLINEKFKLFHKCIETDILLIPAYTASMDLQSSAETMSEEYNCIVVLANACSALGKNNENKKRIGFVTVPAKRDTDRSKIIKRYCQSDCKEECQCKCIGKKISIDFCHTEMNGDKISYEIKESSF